VGFLANPKKYLQKGVKTKSVWVTVPQEQSYEYAMGLYYLVGSSIMGPMGRAALPYRSKSTAETTAKIHDGQVLRFNKLTPQLVYGQK